MYRVISRVGNLALGLGAIKIVTQLANNNNNNTVQIPDSSGGDELNFHTQYSKKAPARNGSDKPVQGKEGRRGIQHDSQILGWCASPRDEICNRSSSFRVKAIHPYRDIWTLRCWQDIQGICVDSRRVWAPGPLRGPRRSEGRAS